MSKSSAMHKALSRKTPWNQMSFSARLLLFDDRLGLQVKRLWSPKELWLYWTVHVPKSADQSVPVVKRHPI